MRLIDATDSIYELRLLGGEPLYYLHLYDVLNLINDEDNIKTSNIVNNGILIIKDERILEILKNSTFHLVISDYGFLSRKKNELIKQLEEHHIRYVT